MRHSGSSLMREFVHLGREVRNALFGCEGPSRMVSVAEARPRTLSLTSTSVSAALDEVEFSRIVSLTY